MNENNLNLKNTLKTTTDSNKHLLTTSLGRRIAYSNGPFVDTLSAITWGFLGFTFYFAVVGLPIIYITIAIIILTFWDAFNDPIMRSVR